MPLSMLKNKSGWNEELLKELYAYGRYQADYSEETSLGAIRLSVIEHDRTHSLYWIKRFNGEVVEFKKLGE